MKKQPKECMVFLLCKNKATNFIDHPTIGKVPACKRCHDKMENLGKKRE